MVVLHFYIHDLDADFDVCVFIATYGATIAATSKRGGRVEGQDGFVSVWGICGEVSRCDINTFISINRCSKNGLISLGLHHHYRA